jgi:hypothetical protein
MIFLNPSFLWALSLLMVPVIIHLFNFRRYKKQVFSDIRFLKQVQQESKAKRKIKEWLILAARMLAITFLVLAFAQPYKPAPLQQQQGKQKLISIYIDNSFSMNNEGPDGQLLDAAKEKARAIVSVYANTDQFQIVTNELSGKELRIVTKANALELIDAIQISPAVASLEEIYSKQKNALQNSESAFLYYISDFQKSTLKPDVFKPDSGFSISFLRVQANQYSNLYIDSVWLGSPSLRLNESNKLMIRLGNMSSRPAEDIAVQFKLNGVQKGMVNISCEANSNVQTEIDFTPSTEGWLKGEISVADHPITFDDKYYFSLYPIASSNIYCINNDKPNTFISDLYEVDKLYKLTQSKQDLINYSEFKKYQIIILNESDRLSSGLTDEIIKYVNNGGHLLIVPAADGSSAAKLNSLLQYFKMPVLLNSEGLTLQVSSLNLQDELFKSVFSRVPQQMDFPIIKQYYPVNISQSVEGKSLISLNNGAPLLWQAASGKGKVFLFTIPFQTTWSNFPTHSLFVPTLLKIGQGAQSQLPLAYTIGKQKWIAIPEWQGAGKEKLIEIKGEKTALVTDVINKNGQMQIYLDHELTFAGNYTISSKTDKSEIAAASMNYARAESNLETLTVTQLEELASQSAQFRVIHSETASLSYELGNELNGTPFWRICVILALLFVLFEILLLKLN